MRDRSGRVCPVGMAGALDSRLRRWLQNPRRILEPYVKEGMTVLDLGCGPGFFSVEMARMVGRSGRVIAADSQEGMLKKLRDKLQDTELKKRVALHTCRKDGIGLSERVDFVLAFYVVHEVPDQDGLFREIRSILKPSGRVLVVEPPIHVSRVAFEESVRKAESCGLRTVERPRLFPNKTVVLGPA